MFRSPKTYRTNRENSFTYSEEKVYKIKTKRHKLPTSWDDVYCNSFRDRNWKKFRKTQWK